MSEIKFEIIKKDWRAFQVRFGLGQGAQPDPLERKRSKIGVKTCSN